MKYTIWQNYFVYAWSYRKPNEAEQLQMENVSLSELIAYQIWQHK